MMKRTNLIFLTVIIFGVTSLTFGLHGQSLEENKVDEFTNNAVKRTSWELLCFSMKNNFTSYFRISRINEYNYFDLKLMIGGIFSIDKDQEIMFKLDNEDIVKLLNLKYEVTCKGCGAIGLSGSNVQGINVSYTLDEEQFEMLKNHEVVKVRIFTNDGYVEGDTKRKHVKKIPKALELVE